MVMGTKTSRAYSRFFPASIPGSPVEAAGRRRRRLLLRLSELDVTGIGPFEQRPGARDGVVELGALAGRHRLAGRGDDLQGIEVRAVLQHPVVEVGAAGQAGGAHAPDHVALAHALPAAHRDAGEVAVEGLIAVRVAELHR